MYRTSLIAPPRARVAYVLPLQSPPGLRRRLSIFGIPSPSMREDAGQAVKLLRMNVPPPPPWRRPDITRLSRLLAASYERWTGMPLLELRGHAEEALSRALFEAPFAVLAHGREADPLLCYGNATALSLWEMDWDTFTGMPSRLTAEPQRREERAQVLDEVRTRGFSDGYRGVRVSRSGKRFRIEKAVVWNVIGDRDELIGQAACFSEWTPLD